MLAMLLLAATFAPPTVTNEPAGPQPDFAVEQAAREFRITVYAQFRETREAFDSRRAMGDELLKLWNKVQPARHREGVLAWFGEAARRSRAGQPLVPYAELEDLRTVTVSEELPKVEGEENETEDSKLATPLILETPPGAVAPSEDEDFWLRIKRILSATLRAPAELTPAK